MKPLVNTPGHTWALACDFCLRLLLEAGGEPRPLVDTLNSRGEQVPLLGKLADHFQTFEDADEQAKAAGWEMKPNQSHLCPDCAAKHRRVA